MPLMPIAGVPRLFAGAPSRQGAPLAGALTTALNAIDAANEAIVMIGQIMWADGGQHTVDTTGSSSIGWRTGNVTFANGSTTVKVGLAPVDTANGPPGRASNAAGVVSYDVSASYTGGGGGITANAWQESVPTSGSKTIANGTFVAMAVQMTARAGADSVIVACGGGVTAPAMPFVTAFQSGSYSLLTQVPNAVITASDGTLGFFYGGYVQSTSTSQGWNSGSATKEYGNLIQFSFPATAYGIAARCSISGDLDFVLYSDPLGTPVAERTTSVDLNTAAQGIDAHAEVMFSSPFNMRANTPYAVILKPTTGTSVSCVYKTFNVAAHQASENGDGYAINRASGAFASQNSGKDRFAVGVIAGAFEHGVSPIYGMGV